MGELVNINGKNIYVEKHGNSSAAPLLYLHGGPGSSCYDFMYFQAERLGKSLFVVGMDQRGVLRSEPLQENEELSPVELVEDAEELRKHLGFEKWSVLGHSFGGYLATLYAQMYPQSIDKLIFECPGFDFSLTLQSLFKGASELFETDNEIKDAELCMTYATEDFETDFLMEQWMQIGSKLGPRRENLYIHGSETDVFERLFGEATVDIQKRLPQVQAHFTKLHENKNMYQSTLHELEQLHHKSLILNGKYDFVFCEEQLQFVKDNVPSAKIITFEESSHFPRIEEPDKYVQVICSYVLD